MTKLDMSRATTALAGDGVWIDIPDAPFRIKATVDIIDDLPWLTSLTLHVKPGERHIAHPRWFAALSATIGDIATLTAIVVMGDSEWNEAIYRRIATNAPDEARIRTVAEWAQQVAWPGGASRAISQMWGVSRSTASRWLRQTRPHRS